MSLVAKGKVQSWFLRNLLVLAVTLSSISVSEALTVQLTASSGAVLEDTILFASTETFSEVDMIPLGDLRLDTSEHVFDVVVDPALTHWWLLGHPGRGGHLFFPKRSERHRRGDQTRVSSLLDCAHSPGSVTG